jgi:ADP-ribose pyrophosphatase YjhB (NUDIX family)
MTLQKPKSSYWLTDDEWLRVQNCLPITCVDVLPFRLDKNKIQQFGLILRHTPHQGDRWCLIGGRLQYKERLIEGVAREIIEALGDKVTHTLMANEPVKIVQYMPEKSLGEYYDPRQHAIGVTEVAPRFWTQR